ncbi:MAG: M23 family metallopeptidase [Verrucomicrobiota bacterium]|nr:M23 family metallopeptidase [Verrucomicrobiota bacterium]
MRLAFALILAIAAHALGQGSGERLHLALPTDNDALLKEGGAAFYQYIIRDYQGVITKPWQGGQYGFVRNPVETPAGLIYTRFHEGMDIRPVHRNTAGEPLDEVRAIADGTVVYTNLVPAHSNYGNYVVVEHRWGGANYYSLYGHLASVRVRSGATVQRGQQLGVMGYTGEGLDRERAHVHLELNLLLGRQFDSWYNVYNKAEPNYHGLYNGINLSGIDIARLYLALRKEPSLTIPRFLAQEQTFYRVALPASKSLDLVRRYPWLSQTKGDAQLAWEISFNRAGVPLKVEHTDKAVSVPTLSFVKKQAGDYAILTRGIVGGSGDSAHLTENGERLMRLFVWAE